jgi:O-antigen/teichoic acid export membrane protein
MSTHQQSLSERVFSATLWNTLLLPTRFAVGIITSVLYYRILSLEQVGLVFLLTSLASTIGLYADLGIERALPRYLPEVEQGGGRMAVRAFMNRIIRLKLLILAVVSFILLFLAAPLTNYVADRQRSEITKLDRQIVTARADGGDTAEIATLEQQRVAQQTVVTQIEADGRWFVVGVAALLILGAIFDVYMQFLTAYFKQRAWNLITLATSLLQPLLVTAFLLLGWGVPGVLLGLVITPIVSIGLAAWQTWRATELLAVPDRTHKEVPKLRHRFINYAAVSYLMQTSAWFYDLPFVLFVLTASLDMRDLAILSFAYKFAKDFLSYVWTPLSGVITPLLTRVKVDRSQAALEDAHASLTRILLLLLVPAAVGLAVLAPYIVAILYPKYSASTTLIWIFVVFTFAESLLSIPHNVLMVYERYRAVIASRLVALLSIPAVLLVLPHFGMSGVAVVVGIVRVLPRIITLIYGVRMIGLTIPLRFAARVGAATALFAAVLLGVLHFWPVQTIGDSATTKLFAMIPVFALIGLGVVLYFGTLRLLGGLDEAERRRILGLRLPFKQVLSRVL